MEKKHEEAREMKAKAIVSVGLAFILMLLLAAADQQSAEQLYKAGLYEEEVGGNLQKAIGIYQDILKRFPDSREVAAKAQLHVGLCYDKLGTREAEKAFQKVIDNYPEQAEAVRQAKERLAVLINSRAPLRTGDAELKLRQVWSGAGVDIDGAVSPDGRYLSFVDWKTGDLAIRELATGTNRLLTNKGPWTQSPEFALYSNWSPDSRRLVYQWYNKDETFELRILDIAHSTVRTLYQGRKNEYAQPFDWSPDGRSVLAGLYRLRDSAVEEFTQPCLISAEGGSVTVLKTRLRGEAPWGFAFSPDGKYIAYDILRKDASNSRDIFLLSADGSTETPLIEHPAADYVFDWAPDGQGLLFISDRTGAQDLWYISVAGGKALGSPQMIKSDVGQAEPLGITLQGQLFYGLQGGATDVYEVGIDPQTGKISSPVKKAVLQYEGHNATPNYSPDGKHLAYISTQSTQRFPPQISLRLLSLETGQVRELHPDLLGFGYPRWSPDGRFISVEGMDKEGRQGIFRVDVQTGDVVPIVVTDMAMPVYSHRWSRSGKAMLYSIGDPAGKAGSMFVHNPETGQDEPIPGAPSTAQFFDISPDGKWLALINREAQRVIRIMPTAGGEPREIYRFEQDGNFVIAPAWSHDGRYVFFSKRQKPQGEGNIWDLYCVSAETGEAKKIDLSMVHFRNFSVHPDGQRIAFSSMGANPEQSQVWVMENFLPVNKAKN
jgi:Tol biopolymer transport system component